MAELKPLGRAIGQPNAPDISAAASAAGALGEVVQGVSKAVGAYKKASDEMEASILYTDLSHNLNKQFVDFSHPTQIATGEAAQAYANNADAYIEGVLRTAPRSQIKGLREKLKGVVNSNSLQLLKQTQDYSVKKAKSEIDIAVDEAKRNYAEASASGNQFLAQESLEELNKIYDNSIELGLSTSKEKYEAQIALKETNIVNRYRQRGENDALASPGTAERSLQEITQEFPEDELTNEQRHIALDAYKKGQSIALTGLEAQRAINAGRVQLDIVNGNIQTPADIYNKDLTMLQGTKAEIDLWKHQHKTTKNNAKIAQFLSNVQQGAGRQNYPASPEVKEAGYEIYSQLYLNEKIKQTGNEDEQLTIQDQANILGQMNVSIPSVDAQINYALINANIDEEMPLIDWALGMVRTVGKETPNAIKLDTKSMAIANLANDSLKYGRTSPRAALEGARNTVNVDEPVLAGRRARQYKEGWENEMRSAFKEMTEADPNVNPTAWGAFRSIYSTQAMLTDNQAAAREGARQVMTPAFGKSKWFRKDEYGYLPPENVIPFGQQGRWLENQINMKLIALAEANHNAPENQVSNLSKIELGGNPKEAQRLIAHIKRSDFDEKHLFYNHFGPMEHYQYGSIESPITYRINGHDREVYLEADTTARLNESGKLSYSVYTINPTSKLKEPVMDPRSKTGIAVITIDSLEEFLPGAYEENNNRLYDDAAKDVVYEQYKQQTPFYKQSLAGQYFYGETHKKAARAQIEKNEKAYSQAETILKTASGVNVTKKDIAKQLEQVKQ
jgi:hypothetical protein